MELTKLTGAAAFAAVTLLLTAGSAVSHNRHDRENADSQGCVRSKALLDRNSRNVVAFYITAFNFGKPEVAVEKYVGLDENGNKLYIQHNPFAQDGTDAFINFVNAFRASNPQLSVRIVRVIAQCDLVVTHSHLTLNPEDRGFAVADIFRVDKRGKVVEHWDVVQPVPETSANDNTMF
jgi:predicted SnoaL-like aldol condensation-catalyzing enzyme